MALTEYDENMSRSLAIAENGLEWAEFGARMTVVVVSFALFLFYLYQYTRGNCLIYPVYIQSVTCLMYALAAFGSSSFVGASVLFTDGSIRTVGFGRYLGWIITCPPALMCFFKTVGLLGPRISFTKINFIVLRDLISLSCVVAAAYQTNKVHQGVYIACGFVLGVSLAVETYTIEMDRKDAYPPHIWKWLMLSTGLFLSSWSFFPVAYFLGAPVFNVLSPQGENIAYAVGDLFAKCVFGFTVWWMRYKVIYPYIEGMEAAKTAVVPTVSGDLKEATADPSKMSKGKGKGKGKNKKKRMHSAAIVVDPSMAYQRLLSYMLNEVGIVAITAFDLDEAKLLLDQLGSNRVHCCLVNLHPFFNVDEQRLAAFRERYSNKPFHLPFLGYSSEPSSDVLLLDEEESQNAMTHAVIKHFLDERQILQLVIQWRKVANVWRQTSQTRDSMGAHMSQIKPTVTFDRARAGCARTRNSDAIRAMRANDPVPEHPQGEKKQNTKAMGGRRGSFALTDSDNPFAQFQEQQQQQKQQHVQRANQGQPQRQHSQGVLTPPRPPSEANMYAMGMSSAPPSPRSPSGSVHSQNSPRSGFSGSSDGMPPSTCYAPGCNRVAQMQCGACHVAGYCGRECQVSHWRNGHKAQCKAMSGR